MSQRRKPQHRRHHAKTTDPRDVTAGGIAGPGGPFDRGAVVIDATRAVLLNEVHVSLVDPERSGKPEAGPILAVVLGGRINKTTDRAQVTYLTNEDGAAAIITQLVGLAVRIGPEFAERLMARLAELPTPEAEG